MSKLVTLEAITTQSAEARNGGRLALPEHPWRSRSWALQFGMGRWGRRGLASAAVGPVARAVGAGLVPDQELCWVSRGRTGAWGQCWRRGHLFIVALEWQSMAWTGCPGSSAHRGTETLSPWHAVTCRGGLCGHCSDGKHTLVLATDSVWEKPPELPPGLVSARTGSAGAAGAQTAPSHFGQALFPQG